MAGRYGPHNPNETYVAHGYPEQLFDTGEVKLNYATVGEASNPALLLVPGQTESWWGYEAAMGLLKDRFQVFAVVSWWRFRATPASGVNGQSLPNRIWVIGAIRRSAANGTGWAESATS